MNSTNFNPDEYLNRLLRDSPIAVLVTKRNEMTSEIRKLDADMQMLVYENYNKFISATDTIRDMKGTVEDMEKKV